MTRYRHISSGEAVMDVVCEDVRVREIDDSRMESGLLFMTVECKGVRYLIGVDALAGICKEVCE